MKWIAPDYFRDFSCIAGECRHSCCKGWEIDIDPETLEYYRSIPGDAGRRLKENIDEGGDAPHFRLTADECCPFLNADGLCDLILELGGNCLCQICADHPRFRNFFSDREEIGLGMCCEEAARLILRQEEAVRLVLTDEDDDDEQLTDEETDLLAIRQELISIAQNRSLPVEARVQQMLYWAQLPPEAPDFRRWAAFLLGLERLDADWTERLRALESAPEAPLLRDPEQWEKPFEQLLVYLLYRHLPGTMEDGDLAGRIAYAALMWRLLRTMFAQQAEHSIPALAELCRQYSSEIEYSDENLQAVLDEVDT
ncbi:MAG: flagellin lysine-N-methylase [Clostridia bacterium]|nr:flagellin lysine-N-methylase [Clostridia bacterium]